MWVIIDCRSQKVAVSSKSYDVIKAVYNSGFDEPLKPYRIEWEAEYDCTYGSVPIGYVRICSDRYQ